MRNLTVYEDGYFPQDPIVGGGASNVTVGGGTQVADAPRGTSQVSTAIPENPNVISEPRPRETYEPLGSDPKPPKTGASVVAEPDLGSSATSPSGTTTSTTSGSYQYLPHGLPTLGGGVSGGAGGGASTEEIVETPKEKKPFPYWILIAGLVGGYLIFRKK